MVDGCCRSPTFTSTRPLPCTPNAGAYPDPGGRSVTSHRTGIAEAEIDVVVPVHVGEVGTRGDIDIEREGTCPLDHPVHGHAVEQRRASAVIERRRPGMALDEVGLFPLHQAGEAGSIEGLHDESPMRGGVGPLMINHRAPPWTRVPPGDGEGG